MGPPPQAAQAAVEGIPYTIRQAPDRLLDNTWVDETIAIVATYCAAAITAFIEAVTEAHIVNRAALQVLIHITNDVDGWTGRLREVLLMMAHLTARHAACEACCINHCCMDRCKGSEWGTD